MKQALKKLRQRVGESIGETLIALLISALALLMLAGAVSTGMRIVDTSRKKLADYYDADNAIANRSAEADSITLKMKGLNGTGSVDALSWENPTFDGAPVISYAVPTPTPEP